MDGIYRMTPKKIERLLEDFANTKDDAGMERWLRMYGPALPPSFFQEVMELEHHQDQLLAHSPIMAGVVNREGRTDSEIRQAAFMRLHGLAQQLRGAWDEQNSESKEWYIDELRRWVYVRTEPERSGQIPAPPPTDTGFQQALRYFRQKLDLAKHCKNPACRAPYFFAEDPRQRYCDDPHCARWGILRSKKLWARKTRSAKKARTRRRK